MENNREIAETGQEPTSLIPSPVLLPLSKMTRSKSWVHTLTWDLKPEQATLFFRKVTFSLLYISYSESANEERRAGAGRALRVASGPAPQTT